MRAAVREPTDPDTLHRVGLDLVEAGFPAIAATTLDRAHALTPHDEPVLTDLVQTLEAAGEHAAACRFLYSAPALLSGSFRCRYLLVCNELMAGAVDHAQALLPSLAGESDPTHVAQERALAEMLARADALAGHSPLDGDDLRGWHLLVNGGLLLHLAHAGDDMRGRYGATRDTPGRCREALVKLQVLLTTLRRAPPCVYCLPCRASALLAFAAAELFKVPLVPWPAEGTDAPGLIVAADLGELDRDVLVTLLEHRPEQVLWAHASSWTGAQPIAADVVTYLYEVNRPFWGPPATLDAMSEKALATLGRTIVSAPLEPGAMDDLAALVKLARAVEALRGPAAPGLLRDEGTRRGQWAESPVRSRRID